MASREPAQNVVDSIFKSEQVNRSLLLISGIVVATLTTVGIWLAFSLLASDAPRAR